MEFNCGDETGEVSSRNLLARMGKSTRKSDFLQSYIDFQGRRGQSTRNWKPDSSIRSLIFVPLSTAFHNLSRVRSSIPLDIIRATEANTGVYKRLLNDRSEAKASDSRKRAIPLLKSLAISE